MFADRRTLVADRRILLHEAATVLPGARAFPDRLWCSLQERAGKALQEEAEGEPLGSRKR